MTSPAVLDETTDPVADESTEATAEATPETAPERVDRGDGRDTTGKFVQKTANDVAADLEEQEAAAAGVEQAKPDAAAAVTVEEQAEKAPVVEPVPYAVRAMGQPYTLPSTYRNADGSLTIKPDGVDQIERLFGRAILLHKREQEVSQQRTELKTHKAAADAELKVLVERVWDKLKGAQTVEDFQEIAADLWLSRGNIDELRALARDRAMVTVQNERPEVSQDEVRDAIERDLDASLAQDLRDLQKAPWAKGLTKEDWAWLGDQAYGVRSQFVIQRQDGIFYNSDATVAYVERLAKRIVDERQKANATSRQAKVAEVKNEAANKAAIKAPPAIGATAGPGSRPAAPKATRQEPAKAETYDERKARRDAEAAKFRRWVESGEE